MELVYKETLDSKIAAMKREREIQKQTRAQKERLIRDETRNGSLKSLLLRKIRSGHDATIL